MGDLHRAVAQDDQTGFGELVQNSGGDRLLGDAVEFGTDDGPAGVLGTVAQCGSRRKILRAACRSAAPKSP